MLFALAAFFAGLTLVLAGGVTGVFYAFSVAVMPGLDAIRPTDAISAMRSVNRKILNPVFFAAFLGTPVAAAVTGGLLLSLSQATAGITFFVAAAVYVLGAFVPTAAVNVPMNNALENLPPQPEDAGRHWTAYSSRWTRWNTARAVLSAAALLTIALGLYLWGVQG